MRLLPNLLFAFLVVPCAAHAQSRSDESAVRKIPQQFAAAWAKHSGHELAKITSEDIDFVNVGGDWRFRESTLEPLETVVRFLRPNLAVIHWSWKIQGDKNDDLTSRKPRFGLFTMIAEKKEAEWLIIEAQKH